jgi:hypothetical protein
MRTWMGSLLWFAATAVSMHGQATLHRHETGFGVRAPAGWSAQSSPEGVVMLPPRVTYDPNRPDNPELYIAGMQGDFDASGEGQMIQELSSAFVKSGVSITRSGEREEFAARGRTGAIYAWEFKNPQNGVLYGVKFYLTSQDRRAYIVMATGEAARIRPRDAQLREMAATMDYQAPKMPEAGPLADDTPLAQQWLRKLRGKVIKQFIGGGGLSGEKSRYLAPDGTYSMSGNTVIAADVGPYGGAPTASASSISRQSTQGRWKIRDVNTTT